MQSKVAGKIGNRESREQKWGVEQTASLIKAIGNETSDNVLTTNELA